MAGSLGATTDQSTWVLTSYLVSNAIVLPINGWLVRIIGRKLFFMICLSVFAASSGSGRNRVFWLPSITRFRTAVTREDGHYRGMAVLKLRDFRITPISVAGRTVKVKVELDIVVLAS